MVLTVVAACGGFEQVGRAESFIAPPVVRLVSNHSLVSAHQKATEGDINNFAIS